jgi:hypothetical protein
MDIESATKYATIASGITSVLSLVGLLLVWWQLKETKKIAKQQFEDNLAKEYRELINRIPTKVMLGKKLTNNDFYKYFDEFYRYFDLCNEQIMLKQSGRIDASVWANWFEGIQANMQLPEFKKAWKIIEDSNINQFKGLKELISKKIIF